MGYPDQGTSADAGPATPEQEYVGKVNTAQSEDELNKLESDEQNRRATEDKANGGYLTRAEVEQLLAERDRRHAEELASAKQGFPQQLVAQHAGGPGSDNHQGSWSLAEQEAAARGETLDHWEV
jgi:hypothetical protein